MIDILEKAVFLKNVLNSVRIRSLTFGGESYALQSLIRKLLEQLPTNKDEQSVPTILSIEFSPFTKESLKDVLELMGFQVDTIEENPHYCGGGDGKKYRMNESDYIVRLKGEE